MSRWIFHSQDNGHSPDVKQDCFDCVIAENSALREEVAGLKEWLAIEQTGRIEHSASVVEWKHKAERYKQALEAIWFGSLEANFKQCLQTPQEIAKDALAESKGLPDRFQQKKECEHALRIKCKKCEYEEDVKEVPTSEERRCIHLDCPPAQEKCEGWHNTCIFCQKCLPCKKCVCPVRSGVEEKIKSILGKMPAMANVVFLEDALRQLVDEARREK